MCTGSGCSGEIHIYSSCLGQLVKCNVEDGDDDASGWQRAACEGWRRVHGVLAYVVCIVMAQYRRSVNFKI
jgi:hypothetical protein